VRHVGLEDVDGPLVKVRHEIPDGVVALARGQGDIDRFPWATA
jgi:hypothetical protein